MNEIKKCRHCGQYDYWGSFRWFAGWNVCRRCYKSMWEHANREVYRWDDLDGPFPTDEEIASMEASNETE